MDYSKIVVIILWSDVMFNEGTYSFQTHETPAAVSDSCLSSSLTSTVSGSIQASSTPAAPDPTHASSTSTTLRRLAEKDDTFVKIQRGKKVFIDKTRYIEELLNDERSCVLFTRPRRFGKSNFLQMLSSFFSGEKDMFYGTQLYSRGNTDKEGQWVKYPVIKFSFAQIADYGGNEPSAELFKTNLYDELQNIADSHKVGDCGRKLSTLVVKLQKEYSLPVVILIDEYDYPFTSILHTRPDGSLTEEEKEMLQGMKDTVEKFFTVIKSQIEAERVKLAYVTGVARLAFDALDGSGPNNFETLNDDEKYSCMVGFTESEVGKYLRAHVDQFAKTEDTSPERISKKLFKMYGGYSFSRTGETEVANPVSLTTCLRKGVFSNYWCPTSSLGIVLNKMYADEVTPEHFIRIEAPLASLYERSPTHNAIPTCVYMLQHGYLTIKKYIRETMLVVLDYPNDEIKDVLINNFNIRLMLDYPATLGKDQGDILRYLKVKQVSALVKVLNKLGFRNQAPAPYQLKIKDEFSATSILYLIFRTIGLNTRIGMEMKNRPEKVPLGDIDLLIMTHETSFAIEAKYGKEDILEGFKQLIGYIIKNEKAFLDYIAESRNLRKLPKTDEIYFLCLNFKKDEKGSTQSVETFIGLPFQPWEPSTSRKEGMKDMKLWFNHMEIKGDMTSIRDEIKSEYETVLSPGKAVW